MTALSRIDTSALNRALVGFDSIFDSFERRFANQLQTNYPPYNVAKISDNEYYIEVAVAGFNKSEVTVEVDNDTLTIKGDVVRDDDNAVQYLHRGLSARSFVRQFTLAEHMVVRSATIKDGVLTIYLERIVPEDKKAKLIDIVEVK